MNIAQQIQHGMARAFFGSAWADACEEAGGMAHCAGKDIFDLMPSEIDPGALSAAQTLAHNVIVANNRTPLSDLYREAESMDAEGADRVLSPDLFGHYLAMQAMGHGVGLESFGHKVRDSIRVPYLEFGSYSLEKDYF